VKRAGSAVELRPAPKARNAAHPQERQHSAAEGGTRDRVRPAGALRMRRLRRPASGAVTRMGGDAGGDGGQLWRECAAPGATRLGPGPEGDAQKKFTVLNTVLIFGLERRAQRKPLKSLPREFHATL
jgi:hypothetical protein